MQDPEGNLLRYSLEDAANKVGVSKKSLDDYLLQLRFGKKFGFDFQRHKDDKVGVLRSFVKTEKGKQKSGGASAKKGATTKGGNAGGKRGRKASEEDDEDNEEEDDEEGEEEFE